MRFRLYREHGALNSPPVFNAVEQGLKRLGHDICATGEDIPVIWSVLWYGRMKPNKAVYDAAVSSGKKVLIIEVGNLFRGKTWRISLNHIHGSGIFNNADDLDQSRPEKLGIRLETIKLKRRPEILIAGQHQHSLQWQGMPPMAEYMRKLATNIRKYSDRPIVVRPHPRSPFSLAHPGLQIQSPSRVPNTYDDFNFSSNYHCVINHNAGAAVRAAIDGVPVITDSTSLAYEVSGQLENIEQIVLPDREQWFLKLCHTEYTLEEISQGLPFIRLEKTF